jgi:predicted amidohydrolase YtcJ
VQVVTLRCAQDAMRVRDVSIALAIACAVVSIAWPIVERWVTAGGGSACPLGFGGGTDQHARHQHHQIVVDDVNTTTYINCALVDDGGIGSVTVSSTGRILDVRIGETAASVGRDCKRSRLVPGFVDAHAHVITGGFARGMIDLSNARSRSDFVETLAKGISRGDGAWTLASGWDESRWSEKETPRIEWLDDRFDGVKVFALRADAHVGFASAAALEAAGLMDENVEIKGGIIERDEAGTPTGVVKELATAAVAKAIPTRTRKERDEALTAGIQYLLSHGITSVGDFGDIEALAAGSDGYERLWEDFETLAKWDREGSLPIRVTSYMPLGDYESVAKHPAWNGGWTREDPKTQRMSRLRLGGVKAFLDGSLGGRTAAMLEPYADAPGTKGKLMYPPGGEEERNLRRDALAADAEGLQIAVHAIGDAAVEQALDVLAELRETNGDNALRRFRIEHAQHLKSPIDEHPRRFAELGAVASVQPTQTILDAESVEERLGSSRAERYYALRTFLKHGVPLAGGSDWPIVSADVFQGIAAAVQRDKEALTADEALRMFTKGGAHALRLDGLVGTLNVGAMADFVIVDGSLLEVTEGKPPPKVVATYVGGECVYGDCLK